MDFNITNGCNLACTHCHSSSGSKLVGELSNTEIVDVLNQAHRLGVLRLAIAGGEPFMHPYIYEILAHACSLPGWEVSVITNGTFFKDERRVGRLAAECPDLTVNVSLDGSNPRQFNILRHQGDRVTMTPQVLFAQVSDAVRSLVSEGIKTAVNLTLSAPTIDDCLAAYDYAIGELGATSLLGIKFFPGGYGQRYLDMLELSYSQWSSTLVQLTRLKLAGEIPSMQISVPGAWEFYLPLIEAGIDVSAAERSWGYRAPLREPLYRSTREIGDVAGFADLAIGGDGTVYPSVLYVGAEGAECGNIRQTSLEQIWRDSALLQRMRHLTLADIESNCGKCALADVCGGGSRPRAFAKGNSIDAPDTTCPIIRTGTDAEHLPAPTPSSDNLTRAAEHFAEGEMHIIGHARGAIRVFARTDEVHLRAENLMIRLDPPEARALMRALRSDPESLTNVASHTGAPSPLTVLDAETASCLRSLADTLELAGISAEQTEWFRHRSSPAEVVTTL
ncbi:MAG: radical SAM/SPASM domain-containing protein [Jatrophihabitans sp.]